MPTTECLINNWTIYMFCDSLYLIESWHVKSGLTLIKVGQAMLDNINKREKHK